MEIRLGVQLTEPRQAVLIAGLVGLAAGAGFSCLLVLYGVLVKVRGFGPHAEFFGVTLLFGCVEGLALSSWLRNWRTIRGMRSGKQKGLALACWGLTTINLILFTVAVR